jgi:hypothetical protein
MWVSGGVMKYRLEIVKRSGKSLWLGMWHGDIHLTWFDGKARIFGSRGEAKRARKRAERIRGEFFNDAQIVEVLDV